MKKCYIPKVFSREHLQVIKRADALLQKYYTDGIVVTVRTLYYRFVAKGWFPDNRRWINDNGKWVRSERGSKNAEPNYKWLDGIIGDARLAGLIDWSHLQDLTRRLRDWQSYADGGEALRDLADTYDVDMWKGQKWRPEVWVEKDALAGAIHGVCVENNIPYFSCRGYTSLTAMWQASMRIRGYIKDGHTPIIYHFGDHDPSGIDMSRDIFDRLFKTFIADVDLKRVALNMDQISDDTPPDPVKVNDSRSPAYVKQFGHDCWELDAMEPYRFRELIEANIKEIRDTKAWASSIEERDATKAKLKELAGEWEVDKRPRTAAEALTEIKSWKLSYKEMADLKRRINAKKRR